MTTHAPERPATPIGKECPVCRAPLSALRTFLRPAWARWRCAACDSLIGMDTRRRLVALAAWLVLLFGWLWMVRRSGTPEWLSLVAPGLLCFIQIAWIDRVIVVERVGRHCRNCGYDLRRAADGPCPECGAAIDAEAPVRADATARPRGRRRAGPLLRRVVLGAVILLGLALLAAGIIRFLRA